MNMTDKTTITGFLNVIESKTSKDGQTTYVRIALGSARIGESKTSSDGLTNVALFGIPLETVTPLSKKLVKLSKVQVKTSEKYPVSYSMGKFGKIELVQKS